MKIITVMGCRPNLIKYDNELPNQIVCWTGQHYDYEMSTVFFKELKIGKPKWNLNCRGNETGKMIDKMIKIFLKEKPTLVQVFGDTNSSLAGALAGAYANVPVVHVESGLRSFDMSMPEEINRVLIDRLAKVKFCPNEESQMNLLKEGMNKDIYVVGDPTFDSLGKFLPFKKAKNYMKYILFTLHRNFNVDNIVSVKNILKALEESKETIIFPIHPRTKKNLAKFKIVLPKNIKPYSPTSYKETLALISNAKKVITDSGGIQREAFWMNIPVIILRNETEWNEIINKKGGILVGTDPEKILNAIRDFRGFVNSPPEFGAKKRIRETIYKYV